MPRSRTSRSASPQTQRPQEDILSDRDKVFQNVREIFQSLLDDEIVRMVLIECNWREDIAVDKLLIIAEDAEAQKLYKQKNSQLRKIAEGVFGTISFEEYKTHGSVRNPAIPDSKLSPNDRIIGRPVKTEKKQLPNSTLPENQDSLLPRGSAAAQKSYVSRSSDNLDIHFPKLPSKRSAPSSAFSSESSHSQQSGKYPGSLSSDTTFISQAQSAYNQQYDDAASAQRWEQYKQKFSEHYVENIEHSLSEENTTLRESQSLSSSECHQFVGKSDGVLDSSRAKSGRNFPVRLISRDHDENTDLERPEKSYRLDSADLDESIFKSIYEAQSEQFVEQVSDEIPGNGQRIPESNTPRQGTPTPGNLPMTLPVIELSVEAEEFVPRSKSLKADLKELKTSESSVSAPVQVPNTSRSSSIEIKPGARNVRSDSPASFHIGSPVHASPSISPALSPGQQSHRSPPNSSVGPNNPASLAGSPVFLTLKWSQGLQCVSASPPHQTPILSTSPRYLPRPQPHLQHAAAYRLHRGPPPIPFQPRMVYPVAQPPFFRIPPPHITPLRQAPVHVQHLSQDLEDRAALATGSPIMATAESHRNVQQSAGTGMKVVNMAWINQCAQKIKDQHKAGKKVMVIVRGLPGSGKSTLSRGIKLDGVVLSTDDYFVKGGYYKYNPEKLPESHQWNRERVKEAMKKGTSPIIIDNTNTQKWEFKTYINMAVNNNYHVEIFEPGTPWKFKPNELAKKTVHGVPKDQIQRMLDRYEHNINVDMITGKHKSNNESDVKNSHVPDVKEMAAETGTAGKEQNENEPSKLTDNRSWDLGEEKAAHLARRLNDSKASYSSRASSDERHSGSPVSRSSPSLEKPSRIESPAIPDYRAALSAEESNLGEVGTTEWFYQQKIDEDVPSEIGFSKPGRLSNNASPRNTESSPIVSFRKSDKMNCDTNTDSSIVNRGKGTPSAKLKDDYKEKIFALTEKLSPATLKQIDDMINDYMKGANLSVDELQKREEELNALVQLLPVDDDEMNDAEMLIHLRLHHLQDDTNEASNAVTANLERDLKENEECQDSTDKYMVVEDSGVVAAMVEDNADAWNNAVDLFYEPVLVGNEAVFANNSDLPIDFKVEGQTTITDNGIEDKHAECSEEFIDINEKEHDDLGLSQNDNRSTLSENGEKHNDQAEIHKALDIELLYWNKAEKQTVNHVETVDTKWDDSHSATDNWDKVEGESNHTEIVKQEVSKPQRVRKQKYVDKSLPVNRAEPESGENNKNSKIKISTGNTLTESNPNEIHQKDSTHENHKGNDMLDVDLEEVISSESSEIAQKIVCDRVETTDCLMVDPSEDCIREEAEGVNNDRYFDLVRKDEIETLDRVVTDNENSGLKTVSHISDDSNSVSLVHNSSLDLLNKAYANVDLTEDHVAQDNCNGSNISSHSNKDTADVSQVVVCEEMVESENETCINNRMEDSKTADLLGRKIVEESKVTSSPVGQSAKPKKKSQRKLAAKFQEPLISNEEKKKLFSKDWTTLTSSPVTPIVQNDTKSDHESMLNLVDNSTMTSDNDFRAMDNLARGGFVDSSLKYMIGRCVKVVNDNHAGSCESNIITKVHLIHKSTCTDDLKNISYSDSVRFLKTCFPDIVEDELECVLVNCHNNVEWAINLLLDWKYSLHLTEEEKQQFVDGMEKVKLANEPLKQPSSLTELCFKKVESQNVATRDELEVQLIEISKERLHRIEDENMTRIRLHRSTSVNETPKARGGSSNIAKRSPNTFNRSLSMPHMYEKQQLVSSERTDGKEGLSEVEVITDDFMTSDDTVSNIDIIKVDVTENNDSDLSHLNEVTSTGEVELVHDKFDVPNQKMDKIRKKIQQRELATPENEASNQEGAKENLKQDTGELGHAEEQSGPALTIDLPSKIIGQLEKMFGSLHTATDSSHISVPVDYKTALGLYQCVKYGIVSYTSRQQQLLKDEEMARRLQEQENAYVSNQRGENLRFKPGGKFRKYVPIEERLSQIQTRDQASTDYTQAPVTSFESIMQEEEAEERKKIEFQKMLELEGGPSALSTRVKRTQLYQQFPTVDRSAIDSCFEANCFNMAETVQALRWSLGHPEERSRSDNDGLDTTLMESTKQQSMQEMLDSYLYMPQVTKDYQDGVDPDYEDYRGEANLHIRIRHECFQKAQEAFRQGLKQVASFYSQQGHLHTQKIKEANMRASEQILADRNADLVKNGTLDLHGLHIDEAIAALTRILPDLERDRSKRHITIITGRGSHSRGGVAKLRPSVIAYLKRFFYSFTEEQTGVLKVTLKHKRTDRF